MLGDERASTTSASDAAAAASLRAAYHASHEHFNIGLSLMGATALRWLEPRIMDHHHGPPTPSATVDYGWTAHEIFLNQNVADFRAQSDVYAANSVPQTTASAWSAIVRLMASYVTISKILEDDRTPTTSTAEKRAFRNKIFGELHLLPYYPTSSTPSNALRALECTLQTIAYGAQQPRTHRQILLFDRVNDKLHGLHEFLLTLRPGDVLRLPTDVLQRLPSRKQRTIPRLHLHPRGHAAPTPTISTSAHIHNEQGRKRPRGKRKSNARRRQPPPPLQPSIALPPPLRLNTALLSPPRRPTASSLTLCPPTALPPPQLPLSTFSTPLQPTSLLPATLPLPGVPTQHTTGQPPQPLEFSPSSQHVNSALSPSQDIEHVCCFGDMDDEMWSFLDHVSLTSPTSPL